jgi:protease-4
LTFLKPNNISSNEPKIALIDIYGPIISGKSSFLGMDSYTTSEKVLDSLNKIKQDKSIKAIVLRINSPGGTAGSAQEIYSELMKLRENGMIIVSSLADVAASGAYYIAASSNFIVANRATQVGSIGVIMSLLNFEDVMEKIGVKSNTIKSGKYKDLGSSYREIKEEEKELLQYLSDDIHKQFIHDISKGRNIDINKVKEIADGRIFSGKVANEMEVKLVDKIGNFNDAIEEAKRLANIKGFCEVKTYNKEMGISKILFNTFFDNLVIKIKQSFNDINNLRINY